MRDSAETLWLCRANAVPTCARISAPESAPFLVWVDLNTKNNYFWQYLSFQSVADKIAVKVSVRRG